MALPTTRLGTCDLCGAQNVQVMSYYDRSQAVDVASCRTCDHAYRELESEEGMGTEPEGGIPFWPALAVMCLMGALFIAAVLWS